MNLKAQHIPIFPTKGFCPIWQTYGGSRLSHWKGLHPLAGSTLGLKFANFWNILNILKYSKSILINSGLCLKHPAMELFKCLKHSHLSHGKFKAAPVQFWKPSVWIYFKFKSKQDKWNKFRERNWIAWSVEALTEINRFRGKVHGLSFPEVNCRKIPLQIQLSLMRKENN